MGRGLDGGQQRSGIDDVVLEVLLADLAGVRGSSHDGIQCDVVGIHSDFIANYSFFELERFIKLEVGIISSKNPVLVVKIRTGSEKHLTCAWDDTVYCERIVLF